MEDLGDVSSDIAIRNKLNNFDKASIFKYNNKNIVLIGDKHDVHPISYGLIDVINLMSIYDPPVTVLTEGTIEDINTDVPDESVIIDQDYEPQFEDTIHSREGNHIDMAETSVQNTIKTDNRKELLVANSIDEYIEDNIIINYEGIEEEDDGDGYDEKRFVKYTPINNFNPTQFLLEIYRTIVLFNMGGCREIDTLLRNYYDHNIQLAMFDNQYYKNNNSTSHIKLNRLETFMQYIEAINLTIEQKRRISYFFLNKQDDYTELLNSNVFNESADDIEITQYGRVSISKNFGFAYIVDFLTLCKIEKALEMNHNIVCVFGTEHINIFEEYFNLFRLRHVLSHTYITYSEERIRRRSIRTDTLLKHIFGDNYNQLIIHYIFTEELIHENVAGLNIEGNIMQQKYKKKYLKYKQKYLQLKNNFKV